MAIKLKNVNSKINKVKEKFQLIKYGMVADFQTASYRIKSLSVGLVVKLDRLSIHQLFLKKFQGQIGKNIYSYQVIVLALNAKQ